MKLIIDVEKDYYEMIKYNVEHGQDYKTFEIIANGVPYNPTGDSISREGLKEVINDLFRSGEYDCNSVLKAIDNASTVTPSLNLNNITEEDIEKFKTINFEQIPIRVDKVQEIIDNAPAIDISGSEYFPYRTAYFNGVADGRATARPQDEWIPVSERLPEEGVSVLVCVKTQGGISQYVSERFHDKYWSALCGMTPIAWRPLPEPYKKGGAE